MTLSDFKYAVGEKLFDEERLIVWEVNGFKVIDGEMRYLLHPAQCFQTFSESELDKMKKIMIK